MGAAAYNRGSQAISRQIDADAEAARAHEVFGMIDNLNAMPKAPNAPTPFGPIEYIFAHGGCWATCPVTGFGYFYKTLREAVRAWNVDITGYVDGKWRSVPRRATRPSAESVTTVTK
jgi:hypothetical protein